MAFKYDVGVVGGAGHVGLPLAAAFASAGSKVVIYDLNREALAAIRAKRPPFLEKGLEERLKKVVGRDLFLSDKASVISLAKYVVVVIGTPVDEYLNPKFSGMREFFKKLMPHFRAGQIVILRSTVFPGTSQAMAAWLAKHKLKVEVAFCPERIAEGNALEELHTLPQIVSGFNRKTVEKVKELFFKVAKEVL
jgi:UDP-N-acetyl-D-mannosaminuronic acid dehydrogenase